MIVRIGNVKLFTWRDGTRALQVTLPGYVSQAPKLRYGWAPFFVGHHGHKTVWTYRKVTS